MLIRCEENADGSMEGLKNESQSEHVIGDRSSSDVVVRIRTNEGRDEWVYCHSNVLISKSKYFADRLSDNWPTCQILDSRNCVEVFCEESSFDYYMTVLRILYVLKEDSTDNNICHGVRNALGTLRVAVDLSCPEIIAFCVEYLEAVPWEETEEEEILRIVPSMGLNVEKILSRLQPVNQSIVSKLFISATRFATSSPSLNMNNLKISVQEQLEYMLTDDDDSPLLYADEAIKVEVLNGVNRLFTTLRNLVESLLCDTKEEEEEGDFPTLMSVTSDLCWAWQILAKLEILRDFVLKWMEISENIVKVVDSMKSKFEMMETKLKVLEVTAKVLEAVGYGTVILPGCKRLYLVKIWLPFVQAIKPLVDTTPTTDDENDPTLKFDGEIWQSMESTFVSLILTLPSGDLAEILTEWLANQHIRYPDLTEAFEVWCYRSKLANPRLASIVGEKGLFGK